MRGTKLPQAIILTEVRITASELFWLETINTRHFNISQSKLLAEISPVRVIG